MNIIVVIKQVPDTTEVRIDPVTNTLVREGVASIINPFDTYAIEEAVRLKERFGGTVTVLSMGPNQVIDALREAISVGADQAALLTDRAFAGADTWATSLTLASALKIMPFDLVLAGKQAIDGDTAQVGPGIAAHLDLPQVCYVSKVRDIQDNVATVETMMDNGHEALTVSLPAVFTVVKEINEPRLPSLKGKARAKKAEIRMITAADLQIDPELIGLKGSPTCVNRIFSPPRRSGGEILHGDTDEMAKNLVTRLKEAMLV